MGGYSIGLTSSDVEATSKRPWPPGPYLRLSWPSSWRRSGSPIGIWSLGEITTPGLAWMPSNWSWTVSHLSSSPAYSKAARPLE